MITSHENWENMYVIELDSVKSVLKNWSCSFAFHKFIDQNPTKKNAAEHDTVYIYIVHLNIPYNDSFSSADKLIHLQNPWFSCQFCKHFAEIVLQT